jgi:CRP-like cAMP-binding protein
MCPHRLILPLLRRIFLELLGREPSLFLDLCERLIREIILLEYKLTCTACKTIEGNIALLLLALGSKYGMRDDKGLQIDLELRRATLMEILGISRESLMRALRKLTQRGIILCQDRRIMILDEDRLKSLAEPLPAYLEGKLL